MTPRQTAVLGLLILGQSNKQIAQRLIIDIGTVKTHITALYELLEVTNRVEATLAAQRFCLVEKPPR